MATDLADENGLPIWPAAERNKEPILAVLSKVLPERGLLLEIASGTGQHAAHFAAGLVHWTIQPSDCDREHLDTLKRRVALIGNPRLLPPIEFDVTAPPPALEPTAIYCANMLHIAPWAACLGLFDVAARMLGENGLLVSYGPYAVNGAHTAESNDRFDQSLRSQNPQWGVRDLGAIEKIARVRGIELVETHQMPANNLLLVWQRRQTANP